MTGLRLLAGLLALFALAYLALCGWFYLNQRDFIYFPQFTRVDVPGTDLELDVGDLTLHGWVVNPGKRDAIIYLGGNAEAIEALRPALKVGFPEHTGYLLPYRGYGPNEGSPDELSLYSDAVALFDHVRSRHPRGDVVIIGRSLGSGVASFLASRRPVDRLVLVTPFDSLADVGQAHYRWLPVRWLVRERYDSRTHLRDHAGSVLVVRAERDQIIPATNTARLLASLGARARELVVPGADHNHPLFEDVGTVRLIRAYIDGPDPMEAAVGTTNP